MESTKRTRDADPTAFDLTEAVVTKHARHDNPEYPQSHKRTRNDEANAYDRIDPATKYAKRDLDDVPDYTHNNHVKRSRDPDADGDYAYKRAKPQARSISAISNKRIRSLGTGDEAADAERRAQVRDQHHAYVAMLEREEDDNKMQIGGGHLSTWFVTACCAAIVTASALM
jgi:hypothetical protein